jgi:murein DD-endopeptidase MepM/ murein hydrolase activator NlpD
VDFQRDIQPGDRFSVLFERFRDGDGDLLGHGRVLHAELVLSGRRIAFWRHELRDGTTDWFDAEGRSLRRAFLRTPLDGARISSGFGMRNHPVLGFTRMHRGRDFAAPSGTPVYAAANGTVISARHEGAYGRIVRLRHAGGVETRYAHLSGFARGIAPGRRVRQGDVIGAVDSTGLSTGPHLHYEVVIAGRAVDPARQTARSVQLAGRDLAAFHAARRTLAQQAAGIGPRTRDRAGRLNGPAARLGPAVTAAGSSPARSPAPTARAPPRRRTGAGSRRRSRRGGGPARAAWWA